MKKKQTMEKTHPGIKILRFILIAIIVIVVGWIFLSAWVEKPAEESIQLFGGPGDSRTLIVYDPDPIYNLDEQVCHGLAKGLSARNVQVVLATVRSARKLDLQSFQNIVICANTYNWAPDDAVIDFIQTSKEIGGKNVVAITVGSGSTAEAREKLEKEIQDARGNLILSKEWWLMRPNDEKRMKEKNVDVAVDQAYQTGLALAGKLQP